MQTLFNVEPDDLPLITRQHLADIEDLLRDLGVCPPVMPGRHAGKYQAERDALTDPSCPVGVFPASLAI